MKITVEAIRAAVKQLRGVAIKDCVFKLPMRDDIALTVAGVVIVPGFGYLHPQTFKDIAGEEAYEVLLHRPRVVCEYDYEEI